MRLRFALLLAVFSIFSTLSLIFTQSAQAGECTNQGLLCSCDSGGASCSGGAWIVSFDCDGRVNECRSNEGSATSTGGLGCGRSRQIDVFDRKCRLDNGGWDNSCVLLGHAVWYAGDCPVQTPPPANTPTPQPSPTPQCKASTPLFRLPGETTWLNQKQLAKKTLYPKDKIFFKCVDAKGAGITTYNTKSVVLPDKKVRNLPPQDQVVSETTLDQIGNYVFRCRTTKTNYWCPSNATVTVKKQPVTVCGGNCSARGNLCPTGNVCNATTGKCELQTCYANPNLCKTNKCETLPRVNCGESCGPNTGLCRANNTCQNGKCVLDLCLNSTNNCSTDRCSILPVAQCGEACGPDTAVCPLYQGCSDDGKCARQTCLDNPSRCQTDMCEVIPLTLQCLNIQPNFTDFALGGNYAFTCEEVANAQKYEFQALYTTKKEGRDDVEVTDLEAASVGGNVSKNFGVTKVGRYIFQCRPCMENGVCTEWGDSTPIVVSSPEPTPPLNETIADPASSNNAYVAPECKLSGCNNTICQGKDDEQMFTTCDMKPEYACYAQEGRCEIQEDTSECGWTSSDELTQCIEDARASEE